MFRNRFFRWCSASLLGHIVLFELLFGGILFIFAVITMQGNGSLNAFNAIYMLIITALLSALLAILVWNTITLPVIRRTYRGLRR